MQSRLEDGWRGELKQKVAAKYGEGLKGQKGGCWWWGVVGVGVGGRGGGGVAQTEACGANCACQAAAAAKEQIKWYVNVYHSLLKMITIVACRCQPFFCIFSFTYFWAVRSRNTKRSNIMLLGILWRRFNIARTEWDSGKILGQPDWTGRGLVWEAWFFLGAIAHTHRGPGRLFRELWNLVSLH